MPITKPCETCGEPVTRPPSHMKNRVFCGKECWRQNARWKSDDEISTRRMVYAPDHPVSGRGDYAQESRKLLYDEIGPGPHPCRWCGDPVEWMPGAGPVDGALVVDHLNDDPTDNRLSNLVASCQPCNGTRHSAVADDEPHIERGGQRLRTQPQTCPTCEETFQAVPSDNQTYCSRECLYQRNQ